MNKAFILSLLKTKYSKLGLSDKLLGAWADKILADLGADATPADAQTAVDGVEFALKMAQSEADAARTAARKEKPGGDKGNEGTDGGDSEPNKPNDDTQMPSWAKGLFSEIKSLKEENAALKQEGTKKTRRQAYERELEGLPDAVKTQYIADFDRLSFTDDEDFNGWIEGKKTTLAELKTANEVSKAANFGRTQQPTGGPVAGKPSAQYESFKASKEAAVKEVQAKNPF